MKQFLLFGLLLSVLSSNAFGILVRIDDLVFERGYRQVLVLGDTRIKPHSIELIRNPEGSSLFFTFDNEQEREHFAMYSNGKKRNKTGLLLLETTTFYCDWRGHERERAALITFLGSHQECVRFADYFKKFFPLPESIDDALRGKEPVKKYKRQRLIEEKILEGL